MLNSSLIEVLRTFSKNEISRFDEMIHSPYFNKSSTVIKFWSVIKNYSPDFDRRVEEGNNLQKSFSGKKIQLWYYEKSGI